MSRKLLVTFSTHPKLLAILLGRVESRESSPAGSRINGRGME